ncbi:MAG: PEP-CTERM sorting domain-containing protein [Colwellia sp.]|nr:PEP-CTERM sorting domain-containing protein [Colwellia sp.]MCW8863528.1 PEP-CTERM sorting domain-containing protein [Colwellia sp.]MCW9079962.1 PEP-CTERM sorting domain-containing protein [Colwellia sp.]
MNIKMLKSAVAGLVLSVSSIANAGIMHSFDVTYDGANFSFDNNSSWDNLVFNVGDSLDITLVAAQGDHWEWLSGSNEWYANLLDLDGCQNTGLSEWSFSNNGTTVGGGSHNLQQSCAHFGPQNALSLGNGTVFDQYQFNYTFESGDDTRLSTQAISDNSPWGWSFNDGVRFQYIDANDIPEPSTLAIFALGIMGLAARRLKNQ